VSQKNVTLVRIGLLREIITLPVAIISSLSRPLRYRKRYSCCKNV